VRRRLPRLSKRISHIARGASMSGRKADFPIPKRTGGIRISNYRTQSTTMAGSDSHGIRPPRHELPFDLSDMHETARRGWSRSKFFFSRLFW